MYFILKLKQRNKLLYAINTLLVILFFLFSSQPVFAETTEYHSAGWVGTNGSPGYSSTNGCQVSNDGMYCSRQLAPASARLYFGSFGQLEHFGIPLDSKIDKIHIKVRGKSLANQIIGVTNFYNKIPFESACQIPGDVWTINFGMVDNTVEKHTAITGSNGLANCITAKNINFRNITFVIGSNPTFNWSADIDNFEIAFDYTPPLVTPTPVFFSEGQKGTVWEIGPDKSNLSQIPGIENVISVVTGENLSVALKEDGTVWTWTNTDKTAKQVKGENGSGFLTDIKKITAGKGFGTGLKTDGTVWFWIQGATEPQIPSKVNLTDIIDIASGDSHRLALKSNGQVYGWGQNNSGQVGIGCFTGNCSFVLNPTLVQNLSDIVAISAGSVHSLGLKQDGTVWGWGSSRNWVLGESVLNMNNAIPERPMPIKIPELANVESISSNGNYNLSTNTDGAVLEWGGEFRLKTPKEVQEFINPSKISAGKPSFSSGVNGHILRQDGTLWQLYVNDIPPKQVPVLKDVIAVASGDQTPALAVVNSTGDVLGDSTVKPFLDLPWDYKKSGDNRETLEFSEAALAINSYFDHTYPMLGFLSEVATASANTTSFRNVDESAGYSSHNGYDWGSAANARFGDDVLAAASGSATVVLERNSGGAGNMIKIDHGNGYQTWYEHLQLTDLIIDDEDEELDVEKGQAIGKIGSSGNCYSINSKGERVYNTPSCAHIHFSVFQDKDGNGSFSDNLPDGVTDPFGWMTTFDKKDRIPDPWETFSFKQNNIDKTGNKSNYLWLSKIEGLKEILTSTGGEFIVGDYILDFSSDFQLEGLILDAQLEPASKASEKVFSIWPGIRITLRDSFGNYIKNLNKPLKITFGFSDDEIEKFKKDTIAIYSSDDLQIWKKEDTQIDFINSRVVVTVDHLTHFALMGEKSDSIAPLSTLILTGDKGEDRNFRSSVNLNIDANDNEGGLGIKNIYFKLDNQDWSEYLTAFNLNTEKKYNIEYYSIDKDENTENIKKDEFYIDLTMPQTAIEILGEEGNGDWYVSNADINLEGSDAGSGISKTEYLLYTEGNPSIYNGQFELGTEGISSMQYRSVDKAGNAEDFKTVTIKIDKTSPNSVVYTSGQRGQSNWYRSSVEIALNGFDEVSGYKTSYISFDNGKNYEEYLNPVLLSNEGAHKLMYYSVDNAGNKEKAKSLEIKIDKTYPAISINATPSFLWPPNGKLVDVLVDGKITDQNIYDTTFIVEDEYNKVEPSFSNFGQRIKLEARRNGDDLDGRLYLIKATAEDMAGNRSSSEAKVIVPHNLEN